MEKNLKVIVLPMPNYGYDNEAHEKIDFSNVIKIMEESIYKLYSYRSEEEHYYFNILTSRKLTDIEYTIIISVLEASEDTKDYWEENGEFEQCYGVSTEGFELERVEKSWMKDDKEIYRVKSINNEGVQCEIFRIESLIEE
jgi:hypothetical protein